jgi:hypothetical protein
MASNHARRGRPRGSGLDDRTQLRRVADLLEADPSLKPTTAIRAIGVSDPSAIRRLRDKLKISEHPLSGRIGSASTGGRPSAALLEARDRHRPSSTAGTADHSVGGLAEASPTPDADPHMAWLAHWYAVGLSALTATVEAQMAIMEDILQMPQVASALRQQVLINEVTKAFCSTYSDVRSPTLH